MAKLVTPQLSPVSFLQAFVAQSLRVASQLGCSQCVDEIGYIEHIGLTGGSCFEAAGRQQLGLPERLDLDQYADLILLIKNQIGANFSRASSDPGVVRVINTVCPFGEAVKEAPELCRMTSTVFGSIAARNFGYAKVELRRRIATNDGHCEVCIYTDPERALAVPGDEYRDDDGEIVKRSASTELRVRVERKIQRAWCAGGNPGEAAASNLLPQIVAESRSMRKALEAVAVVAPTAATVLISGETGVGKEIIARAVHALSNRSRGRFVAVNCGAIPENLVESALFGHEKGAFTGAYDVHHGFFERAEKGTLFLDEIDSLPVAAQVKLLRVLQEGEFERVGGRHTLRTDARILAASNRNIEDAVEQGNLRRDLYYRLNVVPIHIPPLRERRDDLSALVSHFLRHLSEKYSQGRKVLGERAWRRVLAYSWPGNVRELENVLERSFLFSKGPMIESVSLDSDARQSPTEGEAAESRYGLKEAPRRVALETEARLLRDALTRHRGNVSALAREMEITPRAVHQKLKRHAIDAGEYRRRVASRHPLPDTLAGDSSHSAGFRGV